MKCLTTKQLAYLTLFGALPAFSGTVNAVGLNVVYSDHSVVDMTLLCDSNEKCELYRDAILLKEWIEDGTPETLYWSEILPADLLQDGGTLLYKLVHYAPKEGGGWSEVGSIDSEVDPSFASGDLYNDKKLFVRPPVAWSGVIHIDREVRVITGTLKIASDSEISGGRLAVLGRQAPIGNCDLVAQCDGELIANNVGFKSALTLEGMDRGAGYTPIRDSRFEGDTRFNGKGLRIFGNTFGVSGTEVDGENNVFSGNRPIDEFARSSTLVLGGKNNVVKNNKGFQIWVEGEANTVETNENSEYEMDNNWYVGGIRNLFKGNRLHLSSHIRIAGNSNEIIENDFGDAYGGMVIGMEITGDGHHVKGNKCRSKYFEITLTPATTNTIVEDHILLANSWILDNSWIKVYGHADTGESPSGNIVRGNSLKGNGGSCIELRGARDNRIENNICDAGADADDASTGISVETPSLSDFPNAPRSSGNTILGNRVLFAKEGIVVTTGSDGNTIRNNQVQATDMGIRVEADRNLVFNNVFKPGFPDELITGGYTPAEDDGQGNAWNIKKQRAAAGNVVGGPYFGGNYWEGFETVDDNGDGLGDEVFVIANSEGVASAQDNLPLMPPFESVNSLGDDADRDSADGVCDTGRVIVRKGQEEPECTLRAAIEQANANAGKGRIKFNIPTNSGTPIIALQRPLPTIKDAGTLDGSTQPGARRVIIDGTNAGAASGLVIDAESVQVKGITVQNFQGTGILSVSDKTTLTDVQALANGGAGVDALNGSWVIHGKNKFWNNGAKSDSSAGTSGVSAHNAIEGNGDISAVNNTGNGIETGEGSISAGTVDIRKNQEFGIAVSENLKLDGTSHQISGNGWDGVFAANGSVKISGKLRVANNGKRRPASECKSGMIGGIGAPGSIETGEVEALSNCGFGIFSLDSSVSLGTAKVVGNTMDGIWAVGDVSLAGAGHDISENGGDGIYAPNGSIAIKGSATVNGNGTGRSPDSCVNDLRGGGGIWAGHKITTDQLDVSRNCGHGAYSEDSPIQTGVLSAVENTQHGVLANGSFNGNIVVTGKKGSLVSGNGLWGLFAPNGNVKLSGAEVTKNGRGGIDAKFCTLSQVAIADNFAEGLSISMKGQLSHVAVTGNAGDGIRFDGYKLTLHDSNIFNNTGYGVRNLDKKYRVDAKRNWWGHETGPGGAGPGQGDEVSKNVDYADWLLAPVEITLGK